MSLNSKLRTHTSKLVVLLIAYLCLVTLYSFVVPLGEGPDEPGHAAYAFFLAREGRLPLQHADPRHSDVPGEGHQPPLAYILAAPLLAWLPPEEREFDLPGNPRFVWAGGDQTNAVAHGSREYWPWRGMVLAWHLARLVSVALGGITVICTYLAAREIDCRLQIADCKLSTDQTQSPMPLLAAALVALNPQFLFTSALVTNDALLVTLSAVLLWLVVRAPERRGGGIGAATTAPIWRTPFEAAAIGGILGMALLTKQSALLLAPIALISVMVNNTIDRADGVFPSLRRSAIAIGWLLAATALVAGWWYVRNWRLYGDALGLAAFRAEFTTQPFEVGNLAAWKGALAQLHASFWARFGWMNVWPPVWVIWLVTAIEVVAAIGLLRRLVGDRRPTTNDQRPTIATSRSRSSLCGHWSVIALPALALAWVVSFAMTAGLVAWQGRLLFPALPAIAIVLARGLTAWENREQRTKNKRHASTILFFVLCSLFLVVAWLPFGVIRPAYSFHALPEATALARVGTPTYGRYGLTGELGAELRGWRVEGSPRPGSTPEVILIWHALARQNRDWTVFIHLVDSADRIVAEDNRPPRDGAFPMTQWVAGDWVEDRHPLPLAGNLAPGNYVLRVGLYDPRTHKRTGVYDRNNQFIDDHLDVGSIIVTR